METIKLDDLRLAVASLYRERDAVASLSLTMAEQGYDRPATSFLAASERLDSAADNLRAICEDLECRGEKYVGVEI